jgi:hypothetical protein
MSQTCWEAPVCVVTEVAEGLKALSEPRPSGDRIKTAISRAARRAGLSYWRAFDLWYGKARRIDAAELEAIRAANQKHSRRGADASDELKQLRERISALEALVAAQTAYVDRGFLHSPGR